MLVGAALCGLAGAQPGLELIQPDAGLVLGVEWKKILDSPLGATFHDEIQKATPIPPQFERLQKFLRNNLDSIVIAASATALSKPESQPPMLVVVKGRFEAAEIQELTKLMNPKIEPYHGVDVMSFSDVNFNSKAKTPGAKAATPLKVALLNDATLLLGDGSEVRAAIDRAKGGHLTAPRKGILAGADSLVSSNDIWMLLNIPASAWKEAPPTAQMFAGIKAVEFGISFQQGFGMQLNLNGKDAASASSLAQAAQGLIAMAAMGKDQTPETAEVLRKIQINPEGSRVKMALNLDRAEVQKLIEAAKASRNASVANSATPGRAATPAPEPPGPKKIRITGLESGPVEMPYKGSKN